ncbi:MAG: hypothetical protein JSU00_12200 [Acidobacteria bacterium]|nr:hypothetical protein [Acidobacteriota bacterium]
MIVRVRLQTGPRIRKARGKNRHVAAAIAALMWPAVLVAYVLGAWALFAEIQVAGAFGIQRGLFSHWQAWLAAAISIHLATLVLSRYGREGDLRLPIHIFSWISSFGSRRAAE